MEIQQKPRRCPWGSSSRIRNFYYQWRKSGINNAVVMGAKTSLFKAHSRRLLSRKNLHTKIYANSLIGVGIVSSLYHSSRGPLRRYLRWADYTMIAATSAFLRRALGNDNQKLLVAASALLLPVRPFTVLALHTGMMEVLFAKRAIEDPELRMAHDVHKMLTLLRGMLFVADDCFPRTPYIHAAWHLAAAVGVGTCNKLLE